MKARSNMNRSKDFEKLIKIPIEEKKTCQKTRKRFYKYGSFKEETNLPCGKRARWKFNNKYYCVSCWNSLKGKLDNTIYVEKQKISKTPSQSCSKIQIPSDKVKLMSLAQQLELELGKAKSIKDFLAFLKDYDSTNQKELLKVVEECSKSYSLAHLMKLEWKIK